MCLALLEEIHPTAGPHLAVAESSHTTLPKSRATSPHALEPVPCRLRLLPSRPRRRAPPVRPKATPNYSWNSSSPRPSLPSTSEPCMWGLAASTLALGSALCPAQLHSLAVKAGLTDNVLAATALLHMYGKCVRMRDARRVFDGMPSYNRTCRHISQCLQIEHGNSRTDTATLPSSFQATSIKHLYL